MMTKNADKKREQIIMFCMDDMVPQNHMLRLIDKAIDWTKQRQPIFGEYDMASAPENPPNSCMGRPHLSC